MIDDFQTATERFLAWFKSVGGEFQDDLVAINDLRAQGAGRGIGSTTSEYRVNIDS
jgi:SET domain-containing protein 6